jgi:hypothetical protein
LFWLPGTVDALIDKVRYRANMTIFEYLISDNISKNADMRQLISLTAPDVSGSADVDR